jgi:deoxyribose-phosphate aldolase
MTMTRAELAAMMDYTLLKPEATPADVAALVADAKTLGVKAVCVSPSMLPLTDTGDLVVATVCGFPSGKHDCQIKAMEAALAVSHGAHEVDMVIDIGAAVRNDFDLVGHGIQRVRKAIPFATLKVILETAALTDDQVIGCCKAAEAAGADFVKTSTGFHPAGGATVHAIELMAATVGGRLGIKASGGIRTADQAEAMVAAGATRLGVSAAAAILAERS